MQRIALVLNLGNSSIKQCLHGIHGGGHGAHPWVFQHFPPHPDGLDRLRTWRPDGILAAAPDRVLGQALEGLRIPTVHIGNVQEAPTLPSVTHDNGAIGRLGAGHLCDLGHRRFAFIGWPSQPFSAEREAGFIARITAAGARCTAYRPEARLMRTRSTWYNEPLAADASITRWLRALAGPVAVMAANDYLAWRVAELCRQAAIRIPEDIALVGADDDETICHLVHPSLSSVKVGARRIGAEAVAMLASLMAGRREVRAVRVPPLGVMPRASSDLFAIDDALVLRTVQAIAAQGGRPLGIAGLARQAGVSRRTLERRFAGVLGRSVLDEIRRVRVERAKVLLTTTDQPMAAIAERCGFSGTMQFTRTFHAHVGLPPTAYRRS